MSYQLEINDILTNFQMGKGKSKLRHNPVARSKWLPYTVNFDEKKQHSFVEVIAEFVRLVNEKGDVHDSVTREDMLDRVLENPNLEISPSHRSQLKELLQTLFFTEEGQLHLFHPKILFYLSASKDNEKMATFLRDVLWDSNKFTGSEVEDEPTDVVTKLLFESLAPLETKKTAKDALPYHNALPSISSLFMTDYSWLSQYPKLFVEHLDKLLIFYYFFYVSQFALSSSAMFSPSSKSISSVYFNLEWESISQTRTSYLQGWKRLDIAVEQLFTQINCLEMLNHTTRSDHKVMTFNDIAEVVENLEPTERETVLDQLQSLLQEYRNVTLPEQKWEQFVYAPFYDEPVLDKMRELYRTIDFQFEKSDRISRYRDYSKWFVHFCQKNSLLKTRGRLGKTLNITADQLLFLTKLVIKDQSKIRLKYLFDEFKLRGVLFDRDSQKAIVEYFERINILDKKSDSGDALYVKSFL